MTSITLLAPAKVNLVLKVLGKRPDGYHDLYTIFERIDLADKITISKIPAGIEVTSDKFITRRPEDNLVHKAASAILKASRASGGVRIHIRKRIPVAGGLGGGSSDAAAALAGINKIYRIGFSKRKLISIGSNLGADIPFFILDTNYAIGRNRGDELERMGNRAKLWHLLVNPGFGLAARDVYEAYDRRAYLTLTLKNRDDKISHPLRNSLRFEHFETMMHNDLEYAAVAQKRDIGRLIKRLAAASGHKAILSGSGPSVFCLCPTRKEAMSAKRRFLNSASVSERKGWQIFVVGTHT